MTVPAEFLDHVTPVVDERALVRYLGYPAGKAPHGRVAEVLDRQRKLLAGLVEPRAVYMNCSGQECFAFDFPLYDRDVVLCVVTIGSALEAKASEYAARGDVVSAFVLDTLGSVHAEGAAEAAYQQLAQVARRDGLQLGCRISPGYGTWPLSYQRAIFDVLPVERIGVHLTPGLMMVPRKSVSFAAERSPAPIRLREGDQCAYCLMPDCRYRRE